MQEAINYLHDPDRNLLPVTEQTPLKIRPPSWDWNQAVKDNMLFIDDTYHGTPMISNIQLPFEQEVIWKVLKCWFEENGLI